MRFLLMFLFFVFLGNSLISRDLAFIETTRLSVIYFQFNTTSYLDSLTSEKYKEEYLIVKELINANPEINLELYGYQNTKERNNLSEARALKVKQDLIKAGVMVDRLIIKKGISIPLNESNSETDKLLTQKVIFKVVK